MEVFLIKFILIIKHCFLFFLASLKGKIYKRHIYIYKYMYNFPVTLSTIRIVEEKIIKSAINIKRSRTKLHMSFIRASSRHSERNPARV